MTHPHSSAAACTAGNAKRRQCARTLERLGMLKAIARECSRGCLCRKCTSGSNAVRRKPESSVSPHSFEIAPEPSYSGLELSNGASDLSEFGAEHALHSSLQ